MAQSSIKQLKAAAEEIGEHGLRGLSPNTITHFAVQSGSLSHLQAALYTIVNFNYFDKRQSSDTNFEKFPEYFEKIIDAIAELNPYQAIVSCFQSYATCDTETCDFLNFNKVILPTANKHLHRLNKDDSVSAILLLGNEQTASNPPTEAPIYFDMFRQLIKQVARDDARQARTVAQYMIETYPKTPEFPDIFKPYINPTTKRQPARAAECE